MKKGILFDLDGTLWDSSMQVAVSWSQASKRCPELGRDISIKEVQGIMGKPMDEIADIIFSDIKERDRRMELLHFFCKVENDYIRQHGGELFPHLKETFQNLKENYHLYIVSNCQIGYIEAFLDYYELNDDIDDFECYGKTLRPKGENIKLVLQRNQLAKAVYVGDTEGDFVAAKSAGLPFIHARMGYGEVTADVPYITSLRDIKNIVKNIW